VSAFAEMPVLVSSFYREGLEDRKEHTKKMVQRVSLKPRGEKVLLHGGSNHTLESSEECFTDLLSIANKKSHSKEGIRH